MNGIPAKKTTTKEIVEGKVRGQYATTNKRFFKGAVLIADQVAEFSAYVDKSVSDEDLEGLKIELEFTDISNSSVPKPKKK